jgi:photosystem II stability/assembly factor-like uncharacterized protein
MFHKWIMAFAVMAAAIPLVVEESPAGSSTPPSSSPVSAFFLPSGEGWIVSVGHCTKKTCAHLERTSNAGATWSTVRVPGPLQTKMNASLSGYLAVPPQLNIYFANARDGWVYGLTQGKSATYSLLWSTHDAGRNWTAVPTASLGIKFNVLAMSSSRGRVYAIGWGSDETFGLWRSSITSDAWQRVRTPALYSAAGGTNMEGALVFKGASGWLMVGNDRGVTGSAQLTTTGSWVKWNAPCEKVGGGYDVPVANTPESLVDVCSIGGYGDSVAPGTPHNLKVGTNWLFSSSNGGRTFVPISRFGNENTTEWTDGVPGLPASPSPGVIFTVETYAKGPSYVEHLLVTRNDGTTWAAVYIANSPAMDSIQFVAFASPRLGFGIIDGDSRSLLIVSTDGGRTWHDTSQSTR